MGFRYSGREKLSIWSLCIMSLCSFKHLTHAVDKLMDSHLTESNCLQTGDYYLDQYKDPTQPKNLLNLAINEFIKENECNEDPGVLVSLAKAYLLNGKLDNAQKCIQKAAQKTMTHKPTLRLFYEVSAMLALRQGQMDTARQAFQKSLNTHYFVGAASAHLGLAHILMERMRQKPALMDWAGFIYHFAFGTMLSVVSNQTKQLGPLMSV